MDRARKENGSVRWLVLGLSVHGVAAVWLWTNVVCSSAERLSRNGARPTELADEDAPLLCSPLMDMAPAPQVPESSRREPSEQQPAELVLRVRDATVSLAQALEAPELPDADWRAAVQDHAQTLGAEALPALTAVLADDTRSVEEHVAATELLAELRTPRSRATR